jgi:hypothetical protein
MLYMPELRHSPHHGLGLAVVPERFGWSRNPGMLENPSSRSGTPTEFEGFYRPKKHGQGQSLGEMRLKSFQFKRSLICETFNPLCIYGSEVRYFTKYFSIEQSIDDYGQNLPWLYFLGLPENHG